MGEVVFIDTSVLVNLLDVPNMNSHREHVAEVFRAGQGKGMTYVIPVTTIIEAGNHIAQIQGHGDLRHECARRLVDALKMALVDQPPWVLTGSVWDHGMVRSIVQGDDRRPDALALLTQGIGTGDIGILAEVDAYRRRIPSATPVRVWTMDAGLSSYS